MRLKNKELENINCSGGLLSEHFIALMREDSISHPLVAPKTFRLPWSKSDAALDKKEYELRVSTAWKKLLERWDLYGYGKLQSMDPADARSRWTLPLLEALGFEPVSTPKHIEISDSMKFRFSHRGWIESPDNGKPPVVHIVPPVQDLDERSEKEKGQPSPHDALQAYLNVHGDKWGLVTNGLYLRLLRDYHHTYTKGYIEFDLEAIFLTRSFSDFKALYRLAHASRFMPSESGEIYLEEYFKHNQAVGEKVGTGLRKSVISAINTLGNGFLDGELISELKGDQDKCQRFYEEILKTIYRIIFLLYAEQRGMLGGSSGNSLYLEEYSLSALRERAARHSKEDGHKDLWIGLQNTFRMIWKGAPALGIYPYNGMLFETSGEEYTSQFGCKNSDLLEAIRFLTLTEIDGTARRINYSEINVEEIGSIYEGLLEYTPRITDKPEEIEGISYPANSFILDPRGSARKTTGSYYTHPDLVQELIKSALEPVLAERLKSAGLPQEAREKAILSIKVCDMTSGSGAFLIAACNRLALELARVRMEPAVPDDDAIQEAKRDVLQSCIYGVDLNPMAVELTKVSLWINAMVKDKPLNFLDHHIKRGNSLIGATPELIAQGVPDGAFDLVTGDDKKVAKYFKDINKKQRMGTTLDKWGEKAQPDYIEEFARLANMEEDSARGVVDKCRAYHRLNDTEELRKLRLAADAWTAAFFAPLNEMHSLVPTSGEVKRLGSQALLDDPMAKLVKEIADRYKFFHWFLEFPEVFAAGGFDVILGNPPWERIKLQEKEFFAAKDSKVANATTAAARKKLILNLKETKPELDREYVEALRKSEMESKFLLASDRFKLTGRGDVNTYSVFAETALELISSSGYAGIIVPTGIATHDTNKDFFQSLIVNQHLMSLYDFVNKKKLFPAVESNIKFCLFTITGGKSPLIKTAAQLEQVEDLNDNDRLNEIQIEDLRRLNPNTLNLSTFRTKNDARLLIQIHKRVPVLVEENTSKNQWGVRFLSMFHMTNDSHLFRLKEQLETEGYNLRSNLFVKEDSIWYPLYEAKLVRHYNHRYATFEGIQEADRFKIHAGTNIFHNEDLRDSLKVPLPRYWVSKVSVESATSDDWNRNWFIGFRNAISATADARSATFGIIPKYGAGNSMPILLSDKSVLKISALVANFNSFILDYIVRQKSSGGNLNFFIIKQLPILGPDCYTSHFLNFIALRFLELIYTAWDIKAFADDLWREADEPLRAALKQQWDENVAETDGGHAGAEPPSWAEIAPDGFPYPPFKWDDERRARLRAELDAIYAHLYGLTKEELDYILETFPIVKKKDIEKYGSYRTKDLILKYYNEYSGKISKHEGV